MHSVTSELADTLLHDHDADQGNRTSTRRRGSLSFAGIAAIVIFGVLVLLALAGYLFLDESASQINPSSARLGPSLEHPLGTDGLGRDIASRVAVATVQSIGCAVAATAIGGVLGLILGSSMWLLPPRLGRASFALTNVLVAFPFLLLVLFFAVVFGVGTMGAILAVGLAMAPSLARITQTQVAKVQGFDFVAAAQLIGRSKLAILLRHILPNVAAPLLINLTVAASGSLLAFAGLSFLGLGVQPPSYDWGLLLNEGLASIYQNPAGALGPAAAIVLGSLAFSLLGEELARPNRQKRPRSSANHLLSGVSRRGAAGAVSQGATAVSHAIDLFVTVRGSEIVPRVLVRGVSLTIERGTAVGLVGESGSGKTMTALALARLHEFPLHTAAEVLRFGEVDLLEGAPTPHDREALALGIGVVFQDPSAALTPTMRVGAQVTEAERLHGRSDARTLHDRVKSIFGSVGLGEVDRILHSYPHELSGGQRQRVMIAQATLTEPALIVADEPTTALDKIVERKILDLLSDLRKRSGAAMLLISHDLSVVRRTCDQIGIMYAGRIVELLPAERFRSDALHPYSRALANVVPTLDTDKSAPLATIEGTPPAALSAIRGCAFMPRCPVRIDKCATADPALVELAPDHSVACWVAGKPRAEEAQGDA